MEDEIFKKAPSRAALSKQLEIVKKIVVYQVQGGTVTYSGNTVYLGTNKGNEVYTLTNLSDVSKDLFGESEPSGVEYITLDGVTFMTYYGHIIA